MPPTSHPPLVLTHGGAGGPKDWTDGCEAACAHGVKSLRRNGNALTAAVEATVVLEDDPRMNAGTGSNFRLDGRTIEMDAAVMDHERRFGAVAAIERVKNPVQVAVRLLETPHMLLAGGGATEFARRLGFADHHPVSERAHRVHARVLAFLAGRSEERFAAWDGVDPRAWWNFDADAEAVLRGIAGPSDTVGAVARDADGNCAAALSTGGTSIMLRGRVGDTPIPGGGIYAGPAGAVVATGHGEEIMRRVMAYRVYLWLEDGVPATEAVARAMATVPEGFDVGLVAVSPTDHAAIDNRTMPSAVGFLE